MNRSLLLLVVGLVLFRFAGPGRAEAPSDASLERTEWTLKELNGKPARLSSEGRGAATLSFDAEKKRVSGFSGVNRFFGGYKLEGETLTFDALAGTMMAGPQEEMDAERAFLAALAGVDQWRIADGALELLHDGHVVVRFASKPAAAK
jgi:heat shock protein HslJ